VDPLTGQRTLLTSGQGIGGWPLQLPFFDARGHFWMYEQDNDLAQLVEFSVAGEGAAIARVDGLTYDIGTFQEGTWPRYRSFSFDPFTGQLFATFVRTRDGNLYGDYYTHLCTVNVHTGKPEHVIASYPTPNWTLQITWGMSE
jgi:hypothetical protein